MQNSDTSPNFYCAAGYKPEGSVGYVMRLIISHLGQEVERQLAHTDLTNAQWIPIYKLYTKRASTVAELARECQLDAGSTTRMLDRLEAKGLCQRKRSEEDRRVVQIALTEAGKAAAAEIPRVLSGVQNAHLAGFSAEEFDTLKSLLQRVLDNSKAIAAQAQTTPSNGGPDAA